MGMDEASALVLALWWSCAFRVSLVCSMCACITYVFRQKTLDIFVIYLYHKKAQKLRLYKNQRQHVYLLNINQQALSQNIVLDCNHRFTFDFKQNYSIYTHFCKRPKPLNHCFNNFIILKKMDSVIIFCPMHGFRGKVLGCRIMDKWIFHLKIQHGNGRTDSTIKINAQTEPE